MLKATPLQYGGVMVNYRCTAACRHCLYACSPSRTGGYLSPGAARDLGRLLYRGGCSQVHIGGGEPFLDFEGLLRAAGELAQAGLAVDYAETNAYWSLDKEAQPRIRRLPGAGIHSLCISLDPYHAEYVPHSRPLELARLCRLEGLGCFLWQEQFLPALSRLDGEASHSRAELEAALSPDYILKTARLYGIHLSGRAVNIEAEFAAPRPVEELLDADPCGNLLSSGHFHVDMDGFFIPPGCTGLRLPLAEAVEGIPPGKYPVFEALYHGGVAALAKLAADCGFRPGGQYASKCGLCFHIRRRLAEQGFAELDGEYYEEALRYY